MLRNNRATQRGKSEPEYAAVAVQEAFEVAAVALVLNVAEDAFGGIRIPSGAEIILAHHICVATKVTVLAWESFGLVLVLNRAKVVLKPGLSASTTPAFPVLGAVEMCCEACLLVAPK